MIGTIRKAETHKRIKPTKVRVVSTFPVNLLSVYMFTFPEFIEEKKRVLY